MVIYKKTNKMQKIVKVYFVRTAFVEVPFV